MTDVTIRSFLVAAAMNVAAVSCSRRGAAAPDGNSPESEYGYRDAMLVGIITWSLTVT